jgi:hypothetical protein
VLSCQVVRQHESGLTKHETRVANMRAAFRLARGVSTKGHTESCTSCAWAFWRTKGTCLFTLRVHLRPGPIW